MKKDDKPSLSVITVVFNDAAHISRTMQSVIGQTWRQIEYIIIDGGSYDGTLEKIGALAADVAVLISEKDTGIYEAMNKGLKAATGDYVLFMNSGDEFYSPETVEKVFSASPGADIYYGETEMLDTALTSLGKRRHSSPDKLTHSSFRYGMNVSHQAILVRRTLAAPFDTKYKLSADIDWILDALRKSSRVVNTRMYIAKYLTGGISKRRHLESLKERFRIFSRHYGLLPNLFNHVVIAFNLAAYYAVHGRTND